MIKKILVAYDNGEKSKKALDTAIKIADAGKTEIYLATSVKVPESIMSVADKAMIKKLEDQTHEYFENILNEAAAKVKAKGITAHTAILYEKPGEAIVKFAEKENVDIIALGAHNRGPVERFLLGLGSVSNYVLNNAKCPVLIAKD